MFEDQKENASESEKESKWVTSGKNKPYELENISEKAELVSYLPMQERLTCREKLHKMLLCVPRPCV